MKPLSLTFYISEASHHISGLLNALTARSEIDSVTLITEASVSPERVALGWQPHLEGNFRQIHSPTTNDIFSYVEASSSNHIHVFVGMRHLHCVTEGIKACVQLGRPFGIMHEPRASEGLRGTIRYCQSLLTEAHLRRHARFILAIGAHGPKWFIKTLYSPERVFPFAYFITKTTSSPAMSHEQKTMAIRIGYVGRLEPIKGFGDLLDSLKYLTSSFSLDVVGNGTLRDRLVSICSSDSRIKYKGVLPANRVQSHLQNIDILVQPSRTTDDGWGVVVSESLLNGAAVITSEAVGSSICLHDSSRGRIVPTNDPEAIAKAVDEIAEQGLLDPEHRQARASWAERRLDANAGAEYLLAIIRHAIAGEPRPQCFLQ
jgi:glycosyltransferase involved in cell wall biosynthesis